MSKNNSGVLWMNERDSKAYREQQLDAVFSWYSENEGMTRREFDAAVLDTVGWTGIKAPKPKHTLRSSSVEEEAGRSVELPKKEDDTVAVPSKEEAPSVSEKPARVSVKTTNTKAKPKSPKSIKKEKKIALSVAEEVKPDIPVAAEKPKVILEEDPTMTPERAARRAALLARMEMMQ